MAEATAQVDPGDFIPHAPSVSFPLFINSALQSLLLFCAISREIACPMVTLRKISPLDSDPF